MFATDNISLNVVPSPVWMLMQDALGSRNQISATGEVLMLPKNTNYSPNDIERELEKLYPSIYRMVSAMIWGSGLEPEDITQDVFLKAYRNASKFKNDSALSTWVYRIARNTVIDALRKKRFRNMITGFWSADSDEFVEPISPDSETDINDIREIQHIVRKSIADLAEPYRSIVVWREIEDLPYAQIAEITGESEGTLKSRLFYAKKKLRDILIAKGITYELQ
jgi:RNA polymerase sigma-70 factor, ECF subfamily